MGKLAVWINNITTPTKANDDDCDSTFTNSYDMNNNLLTLLKHYSSSITQNYSAIALIFINSNVY